MRTKNRKSKKDVQSKGRKVSFGVKLFYWLLHIIRRIWYGLKCQFYTILHLFMLIVLWGYIILNWDKCISMQFFDQFDGNNILFIVGIVLAVLLVYDIDGKVIKFRRRTAKIINDKLSDEHSTYELEVKISELKRQNMDGADEREDK